MNLCFCSFCGCRLQDKARFCHNCGKALSQQLTPATNHEYQHGPGSFIDQNNKSPPASSSQLSLPTSMETTASSSTTVSHRQNQQQIKLIRKLEYYRDKLLQVERGNRSIMLRRIYDKWCFDL